MRITSKGQVSIPVDIRAKAGLLPNTDVDFEFDGTVVRLVPAKDRKPMNRGAAIVARLRGSGDGNMTADEQRHHLRRSLRALFPCGSA